MKNGKEKMKIMGQKWKDLNEEERSAFKELAEDDILRFQIQEAGLLEPTIEAWESLDDETKSHLCSQVTGVKGIISPHTQQGTKDHIHEF
jgi:uncharacterized protein YaaW (UPF0174 family)